MFVPHAEGHASHGALLESFAEMGTFDKVQVCVVVIAAALQLLWLLPDMQKRINLGPFVEQIRKLIAAKNEERAIKLCSAAPKAPVAHLARVGLEARAQGRSGREAMRAALPKMLDAARSGLLIVLVIGALGFIEGVVVIARDGIENIVIVPLVVLGLLAGLNATRWAGWERELDAMASSME